ncbi:MAG: type II toxin-antitoxin system VapC family toxin, partial [Rhizobiaceae bacterium]|nr:type II toxin-antitoxin system VapC family toxin [Rhizobiaceae bacterium]
AAPLDMADCFAYASARYYRMPLLYKGAKFAATDIEAA